MIIKYSLLLMLLQQICAVVKVMENTGIIYNNSPNLFIKGSGFDVDENNIILELSANVNSTLILNKGYSITKYDDGINLKLLNGGIWTDYSNLNLPIRLILSAVKFASQPDKNLLTEPVVIAQVIPTPELEAASEYVNKREEDTDRRNLPLEVADVVKVVNAGVEIFKSSVKIYQSALQHQLEITGQGFTNEMTFEFEPDIKVGVDYDLEVVNTQKAILKLRKDMKWSNDSGFLIAKSVKVHGVIYNLAGSNGIRVALVFPDPSISMAALNVYETQTKVISINGNGFTNFADMKIIIRPTSPNAYKLLYVFEDTIILQLNTGFKWLPSDMSLRDYADEVKIPLQVIGLDTGAGEIIYNDPITIGYVTRDPEDILCNDSCEFALNYVCDDDSEFEINNLNESSYYVDDDVGGYYSTSAPGLVDGDRIDHSKSAIKCAKGTDCTDCIFVNAGNSLYGGVKIETTTSTQFIYHDDPTITITGSGLNTFRNSFQFTNGIVGNGVNYTTIFKSPSSLSFQLTSGLSWRNDFENLPAKLNLLVNNGEGYVPILNPFPIKGSFAVIVFERPQIYSQNMKLYRSKSRQLHIHGTGFTKTMSKPKLVFSPTLVENVDYVVTVLSRSEIEVVLIDGRVWRSSPGLLYIEAINTRDDHSGWIKFPIPVVIANVIEDIGFDDVKFEIFPSIDTFHQTQTKMISIKGSGLSDESLLNVVIRPTFPNSYKIIKVSDNIIRIQLYEGQSWLPSYLTVQDSDVSIKCPLQVVGITKTNGLIKFDEPVTIGYIIEDIEGFKCDDTCITAFNGVCDYASVNKDYYGDNNCYYGTDCTDCGIEAQIPEGIYINNPGVKVYQSVLQNKIVLTGNGFVSGMILKIEPDINVGVDVDFKVLNKNKAILKRMTSKKWLNTTGNLHVKTIIINGSIIDFEIPRDNMPGTYFAKILADPSITPNNETFHRTQTKIISINGFGFTNIEDMKIYIYPTSSNAYKIISVTKDNIRIQLFEGQSWLPSTLSLQIESDHLSKIPLQIFGIDTGGGEIRFDESITIGYVIKDIDGITCDDSCPFSFNGICEQQFDIGISKIDYTTYNLGNTITTSIEDDDRIKVCATGTDCTDCGLINAHTPNVNPYDIATGDSQHLRREINSCTNTCRYHRDGVCDDPRGTKYCELGTDCQDCGPVGAANFTYASDDEVIFDDNQDQIYKSQFIATTPTSLSTRSGSRRKFMKSYDKKITEEIIELTSYGIIFYIFGLCLVFLSLYLAFSWFNQKSIIFTDSTTTNKILKPI